MPRASNTSADVGRVLAAAARQQHPEPILYHCLLDHARGHLQRQDLANIIIQAARGACHNAVREGVPRSVLRRVVWLAGLHADELPAASICKLLWAAAKLEWLPPPVLARLSAQVLARADKLSPLDIAQLASAAALHASRSRSLQLLVIEQSVRVMPAMDARMLSCVLLRFAERPCPGIEVLLPAAAAHATQLAAAANPSALVMVAATLRTLRYYHAPFMHALAARCIECVADLWPRDAATLALALADLRHPSPEAWRAIADCTAAALQRGSLTVRTAANLAWAFAVAGQPDAVVVKLFEAMRMVDEPQRQLPFGAAVQLLQARMLLRDLFPQGVRARCSLPRPVHQACGRAWVQTLQASCPSPLAKAVVAVLEGMGLHCSMETYTSDRRFRVDIALLHHGRQVAVEVDGPRHFTRNEPYRVLGRTAARKRCLELRGWVVVTVPAYEWTRLASIEQQTAYLAAALDGCRWRASGVLGE